MRLLLLLCIGLFITKSLHAKDSMIPIGPSGAASETTIGQVTLEPTIRFVRRGSRLRRIAHLTAQVSASGEGAAARIGFNGKKRTMRLRPGPSGALAADIEVEDLPGPSRMEVTVLSGGQEKTVSCEIRPEKHWRIFLLPASHVDIGYTDLQERVKVRHNDNTSLALDLCRKYPDFKWNIEVAWAEDNYLAMMPAERKAEFIRLAKEGRIGCQAIYGHMLTGLCSHEEMIRCLYYAHSMARQHGIPFDMSLSTDVPTHVWTLPSVLAGSGIRYFAAGLNNARASSANRLFNKPFYWQGPDGASVLTLLAPGYSTAANIGLADSVERAAAGIDGFIAGLGGPDYPYDAALAYGAFNDNIALDPRLASVVHEWNEKYAYPQIIFCRGPEFFSYIEKHFKDSIPTISGDGGTYWEDGAGSSAHETSISRLAKEDLVTAEKLFSLGSALSGNSYPDSELSAAWKDVILYDEHTWGAARSYSDPGEEMTRKQWAYKAAFAHRASKSATDLKQAAFDSLAKLVKVDEPSVVVFNPLSRPVSDIVRVKATDGSMVEFVAEAPPMAFTVYPLNKVLAPAPAAPAGNTLENRFYRLEFDSTTGAVKSLYDKELDRELADSSAPYGINQYVYVFGLGDALKDATRTAQTPPVTFSNAVQHSRQVLTIQGSAFNTPSWTAKVVLYDNQKRIDFLNTLDKTLTYEREAGYFAFPFGLSKPVFHVELPNGIADPAKDMLPGGGMAWYCAQDFVTASDDSVSVTWTALDSPLITLCDIDRESAEAWPMPKAASNWPSPLDNGHVFGYAFNNYWYTNHRPGQDGEMQFRFSLTSSKDYDSEAASRFGQSVRNPLLAKAVEPGSSVSGLKSRDTISADTGLGTQSVSRRMLTSITAGESLISISPSNVCIQAIKQAESGEGTVIRLREVGGKSDRATVTLPKGVFKHAWKCNLVEDASASLPVSDNRVSIDVQAKGLATILLK